MTAAAQRCHLTLAAVSARIRQLEEVNGLVLLERLPRGVAPTPAGEVLARHARLVFDQVQNMEKDLLHTGSAAQPRFVLLANSSALARPFALHAARAVPDRQRVVRESASEASVQALRSGVAAGEGITVLPRALVTRQAAIACVPLRDAWAQRRLPACHVAGAGDRRRVPMAEALQRSWCETAALH